PALVPLPFPAQPPVNRQAETNKVARYPIRQDSLERIVDPMSFKPETFWQISADGPRKRIIPS
ncbi:MAG: hypothetical protein WBV96_26370, partial [Polyangia bacterium]